MQLSCRYRCRRRRRRRCCCGLFGLFFLFFFMLTQGTRPMWIVNRWLVKQGAFTFSCVYLWNSLLTLLHLVSVLLKVSMPNIFFSIFVTAKKNTVTFVTSPMKYGFKHLYHGLTTFREISYNVSRVPLSLLGLFPRRHRNCRVSWMHTPILQCHNTIIRTRLRLLVSMLDSFRSITFVITPIFKSRKYFCHYTGIQKYKAFDIWQWIIILKISKQPSLYQYFCNTESRSPMSRDDDVVHSYFNVVQLVYFHGNRQVPHFPKCILVYFYDGI